ncbi:hypothetical protein Tcan_01464, partial [Toxocara canis]
LASKVTPNTDIFLSLLDYCDLATRSKLTLLNRKLNEDLFYWRDIRNIEVDISLRPSGKSQMSIMLNNEDYYLEFYDNIRFERLRSLLQRCLSLKKLQLALSKYDRMSGINRLIDLRWLADLKNLTCLSISSQLGGYNFLLFDDCMCYSCYRKLNLQCLHLDGVCLPKNQFQIFVRSMKTTLNTFDLKLITVDFGIRTVTYLDFDKNSLVV